MTTHAQQPHSSRRQQWTPARPKMAENELNRCRRCHRGSRGQPQGYRAADDCVIELEDLIERHEPAAEDVTLTGAPMTHGENMSLHNVACGDKFKSAWNIGALPTAGIFD